MAYIRFRTLVLFLCFSKRFLKIKWQLLIMSRYIVSIRSKSLRYFHIFISRRAYVSHLVKYFKPTLEIIIVLTVALKRFRKLSIRSKSLCYFHIFVSRRAYVSHLVKYFKPTLEIIIAMTVAL